MLKTLEKQKRSCVFRTLGYVMKAHRSIYAGLKGFVVSDLSLKSRTKVFTTNLFTPWGQTTNLQYHVLNFEF
jgi:hypothetical protein